VSLLIEDADLTDSLPPADRACEHCEVPIPEGRDRRAVYCSDRCRRDAHVARRAVAA
jgi:hypothetical protein